MRSWTGDDYPPRDSDDDAGSWWSVVAMLAVFAVLVLIAVWQS